MRTNANLVIVGDKTKLVPYREEHVPRYHAWMADPAILEATASEPLSLEQEFDMQKTWRDDEDKCTFIVLDRALPGDTTDPHQAGMAGDVNLFFNEPDDKSVAEIEIMIAEPRSRRRGLAQEALRLMMAYAAESLGCRRFVAKIGQANVASLGLFRKLGFREFKRVEVFSEVHMELEFAGDAAAALKTPMTFEPYDR